MKDIKNSISRVFIVSLAAAISSLSFACDKEEEDDGPQGCVYSSECGEASICLEGQCISAGPQCNDGDLYCRCLPDLTCSESSLECFEETLVCIPDDCPNGTFGCECLNGNTSCFDGLSCVDAVCQNPPGETCLDTCSFSSDGECDDGGPGSLNNLCELGTDCEDCGPR